MAQVPISGFPAGGPVNGTELIPAVQGGVTVVLLSASLVGPAGPAGPPGPTSDHPETGGPTPSAAYLLGDGGAVNVVAGTDAAGSIQVTTGAGSVTGGNLVLITFAAPYNLGAVIVLQKAQILTPAVELVASASTTQALVVVGPVGAAVSIIFNWIVLGQPN